MPRRSSPKPVPVPHVGPPLAPPGAAYAINCLPASAINVHLIGHLCSLSPLSFSEGRLNARGNGLRFIRHRAGVPPPLSPGPTKERSLPCQVGCGDQLRSSRAELCQFVQPAPAEKPPDREASAGIWCLTQEAVIQGTGK